MSKHQHIYTHTINDCMQRCVTNKRRSWAVAGISSLALLVASNRVGRQCLPSELGAPLDVAKIGC